MASKIVDRQKATERKRARRSAEKKGLVRKGDGKDVDHKKPLSKGGAKNDSNTKVISRKTNRSKGGKIGGKIGGKMVRGAVKRKSGAKGGRSSSRKGVPNKKK